MNLIPKDPFNGGVLSFLLTLAIIWLVSIGINTNAYEIASFQHHWSIIGIAWLFTALFVVWLIAINNEWLQEHKKFGIVLAVIFIGALTSGFYWLETKSTSRGTKPTEEQVGSDTAIVGSQQVGKPFGETQTGVVLAAVDTFGRAARAERDTLVSGIDLVQHAIDSIKRAKQKQDIEDDNKCKQAEVALAEFQKNDSIKHQLDSLLSYLAVLQKTPKKDSCGNIKDAVARSNTKVVRISNGTVVTTIGRVKVTVNGKDVAKK